MAVAACVAALAPPASAGWLAPLPMSAPDRQASFPATALGSDGRLAAAWSRSDGTDLRIEAAVRPAGGTLEAPQIVSEAGESGNSPQVGLDAQDNAVLMWVRGQSFQWATRAAGATAFGDLHTVPLPAGEQASSPFRLAVAPNGAAAATLLSVEGFPDATHIRLRVLTRAPGGDFELSPVLYETIEGAPPDQYIVGPVDMDADPQGGFYATWTVRHLISATHSTSDVMVAVRPPGAGSFTVEGVATGVDDTGDLFRDTRVNMSEGGVDSAGNLIVGYTLTYEDVSPRQSEVRLRSRPAGGAFEPGSEAVTPAAQPDGPIDLALAVNPSGTGVMAWRKGQTATAVIEACVRPAGGPCGPIQTLASTNVSSPVAAIGPGGQIVAAWRREGSGDASFGTAAGGFGPVHDLGTAALVQVPKAGIAVDALGHAVVGFDRLVGTTRTAEAAVYDSVAPSIGSLTVPAGGTPGEPLAFGGSVSDVWGPVTAAWDFGDGSSASGPVASHAYQAPGAFTAALSATDAGGNVTTGSAAVQITDTVAPEVLSFDMTSRVFAVGAQSTPLAAARARVRRGTAFRFRLSEAASVRIAIERARAGRRARGRCRKPSRRLRARPRCTRWVRQGALRRSGGAGANRVPFSGRLGRRSIGLGRRRAVLVATDASGNASRAKRMGFRVVRR